MSELKKCPLCGAELKVYGPEDWSPTFYDPDSGGDPYEAYCGCGFRFSTGTYDYAEFIVALNRRAQPENEPLTCEGCEHDGSYENEREYGYPSPCTKCRRIVTDNYRRKPERSEGE